MDDDQGFCWGNCVGHMSIRFVHAVFMFLLKKFTVEGKMARVTVEDCLEYIPNRFQLVLVACYRARALARMQSTRESKLTLKPSVEALRQIADQKIGIEMLSKVPL